MLRLFMPILFATALPLADATWPDIRAASIAAPVGVVAVQGRSGAPVPRHTLASVTTVESGLCAPVGDAVSLARTSRIGICFPVGAPWPLTPTISETAPRDEASNVPVASGGDVAMAAARSERTGTTVVQASTRGPALGFSTFFATPMQAAYAGAGMGGVTAPAPGGHPRNENRTPGVGVDPAPQAGGHAPGKDPLTPTSTPGAAQPPAMPTNPLFPSAPDAPYDPALNPGSPDVSQPLLPTAEVPLPATLALLLGAIGGLGLLRRRLS